MKVIVAGFPKTGTKSMNAALTRLGYKVYDALENIFLLSEEYKKILHEGWTTEDFRRMYEDVDAVVDMPACHFWEEIHKAFPDAKIILTMREEEDAWYSSFANHLKVGDNNLALRMLEFVSPSYMRVTRDLTEPTVLMFYGLSSSKWRIKQRPNEAMLKMKYRAHNAHVMQNAPRDKLLVYSCSEGWEPLCKFLGAHVPDEPFPRKNVKGSIVEEVVATHPMFIRFKIEMMVATAVIVCAGSFACYTLHKVGPKGIYDFTCRVVSNVAQKMR